MKQLIIIFTLVSLMSYSQRREEKKVDSLLELSKHYLMSNTIKSLSYAKQASVIAGQVSDRNFTFKTNLQIASCLYNLNLYDKSLQYILRADKILPSKTNIQQANMYEIKIKNFAAIKMDKLELQTENDLLAILKTENSNESKEIKARTFAYLSDYYLYKENYEEANVLIDKTIALNKIIINPKTIDTYVQKADILMNLQQMDSAFIYLEKALNENKIKKLTKYNTWWSFGDYYILLKNDRKALESYIAALEDMHIFNIVDYESEMSITKSIKEIYERLGDQQNAQKYAQEYERNYKLYNENNNKGLTETVNLILNDKETESRTEKRRIIIFSAIITLIIITYFSVRSIRLKKKKLQILHQNSSLLIEKEDLEAEKSRLRKKAEEKQLAELILLAKNNNPEFLILFEELYPDFIKNLKIVNPKIKNSEIYFCALAFMNFSSKEIAQYSFVSLSAVHLRKHRIRKKYAIPSELDFNTVMRELNSKELPSIFD
ncbi:hypothetical protein [Sphingobacterium athyrii]|uniref:HTH luxR-type domain-containing protein n=1 Tax=Sphingobacterium athyrii TaxID=2152717 RepID=A0A363NUM2_9SPHI|nr:hypothetical protein [Sphingobacterium athyrii]PUV24515.1 hypothetical protein DCO56_14325 [Sphingobacterium athyrii]